MKKIFSGLKRTGAILVGLVFFGAGLLKLADPVGTGLIVSEYFNFLHIGFLSPLSKAVAVLIAVFETVLGAALVAGVWRRYVGIVTIAVLGFFSLLTAALLIWNPAMDCGCFGEAVHLSHMQSFLKNVILLAVTLASFLPLPGHLAARKIKYIGFFVASALVLAFGVWSMISIPPVDFTAFKPGSELFCTDVGNPDAPVLSLSDESGEYVDEVAAEGNVLSISVYDTRKVSDKAWGDISSIAEDAFLAGFSPVVIVPYGESAPQRLRAYSVYSDRRTIMTLNRSNGGSTWLSDGLIVKKWSRSLAPSEEELSSELCLDPMDSALEATARGRRRLEGFSLFCLLLLVL